MIERIDVLAGIHGSGGVVVWFERAAFLFLVLTLVSAPHSIAATQTAWIAGMAVWLVTIVLRRRSDPNSAIHPMRVRKYLELALWAFFVWSAITSVFSFDPATSIDKLRGTAIFLIFYFVFFNLKSLRAVRFAAFVLIASCMVNALWTPICRVIGRGVEIQGLRPDSPLAKALLWNGDTLLEANGKKIYEPADLVTAMRGSEITKLKVYRPDYEFVVDVKRSDLLTGASPQEVLGFSSWSKSQNWRSSGFYGHYTTYAEMLQLVASLVFGLLAAFIANGRSRRTIRETRDGEMSDKKTGLFGDSRSPVILLGLILAAMMLALLLTVTRASQLAFLVSAALIVFVGLGRKWLLAAAAIGLPIALIGLFFLQQSRHVGFFDAKDDSIRWRETVWREGFELWTKDPRNFLIGVGMDSIKKFAPEWHLFDDGRLNIGHFHSTPLQLVVERGLPALLIWIAILGIYARAMWRGIRSPDNDTVSRGILLGCLGGTAGFVASGMVHYNLGDQEVAMVFFILMAFGMRIAEIRSSETAIADNAEPEMPGKEFGRSVSVQ